MQSWTINQPFQPRRWHLKKSYISWERKRYFVRCAQVECILNSTFSGTAEQVGLGARAPPNFRGLLNNCLRKVAFLKGKNSVPQLKKSHSAVPEYLSLFSLVRKYGASLQIYEWPMIYCGFRIQMSILAKRKHKSSDISLLWWSSSTILPQCELYMDDKSWARILCQFGNWLS